MGRPLLDASGDIKSRQLKRAGRVSTSGERYGARELNGESRGPGGLYGLPHPTPLRIAMRRLHQVMMIVDKVSIGRGVPQLVRPPLPICTMQLERRCLGRNRDTHDMLYFDGALQHFLDATHALAPAHRTRLRNFAPLFLYRFGGPPSIPALHPLHHTILANTA